MTPNIQIIKGIHPGIILERELNKRSIEIDNFALSINESPQVLRAIMKGKCEMNITLSLKIEQALGFEEGFFMVCRTTSTLERRNRNIRELPI